jgi:hypothetical protein
MAEAAAALDGLRLGQVEVDDPHEAVLTGHRISRSAINEFRG